MVPVPMMATVLSEMVTLIHPSVTLLPRQPCRELAAGRNPRLPSKA
jgi:hypothetical protein